MNYKYLLSIILLLSFNSMILSQNISLLQDLRPGSESGVASGAISFNDEIYFIGQNNGPSLLTVFSIDEGGTIRERVTGEGFFQVNKIESSGNSLYVSFTSGFSHDLFRTNGTNNGKQLVFEPEEEIDRMISLSEGIAIVEETFSGKETVTYISNDANATMSIVKNVDIGFAGFSITETSTHVIVSPSSYNNYDGPNYALNKESMELDVMY